MALVYDRHAGLSCRAVTGVMPEHTSALRADANATFSRQCAQHRRQVSCHELPIMRAISSTRARSPHACGRRSRRAICRSTASSRRHRGDAVRFKSGVELINVTATVSDASGRFVSGLQKDDFTVYEDDSRGGHTFQRRARAGEPRHRARHERQHGRREDRTPRAPRSIAFSYDCSTAGRDLSLSLQQLPGAAAGMDDATAQLLVARARAHHAERRHRDVRRRARAMPLARAGPEPEEGAARHLRRQRHVEHTRRPRRQAADPRERGAASTPSASTAHGDRRRPAAGAAAAPRCRFRCRSRFPAGRPRLAAVSAVARVPRQLDRRRVDARRATTASTSPRCAT